MRFYGATLRPGRVAPDLSEQIRARHHAPSVTHQCREQIELLGTKWDLGGAASDDARAEIDREIADVRFRPRRCCPAGRTLEQRAYTRENLEQAARLYDVVVGAEPEPTQLLLLRPER